MDSCPICGSPKQTWPLWEDRDASTPYSAQEYKLAALFILKIASALLEQLIIEKG